MCKASAEVVLCSRAQRYSTNVIHGPPPLQYLQALLTPTSPSVGPHNVSTKSDGCDARLTAFSLSILIWPSYSRRNPFVQITDVSMIDFREDPTAEAS